MSKAREAGFSEHLTKPINFERLEISDRICSREGVKLNTNLFAVATRRRRLRSALLGFF